MTDKTVPLSKIRKNAFAGAIGNVMEWYDFAAYAALIESQCAVVWVHGNHDPKQRRERQLTAEQISDFEDYDIDDVELQPQAAQR